MGFKAFVQLLGTATRDSSPSLLVFFDQNRYLFNVGEGTQRLCVEHKIRMTRISRIFLTRAQWRCLGGFPGMMLTVADAGAKSMSLTGPRNTFSFLRAIRYFVHRSQFELDATELNDLQEEFIDYGDLRVLPVIISANDEPDVNIVDLDLKDFKNSQPTEVGDVETEIKHEGHSHKRSASQSESPRFTSRFETTKQKEGMRHYFTMTSNNLAKLVAAKEKPDSLSTICCYICHTPDVPGKFDPQKAIALGLKRGPQFGQLTRGESITLPDGRVIQPSDCIGPSRQGPIFIVIDCPSLDFFNNMKKHGSFQNYVQTGKFADSVAFIVHMTPNEVICDPEYRQWMSQFGDKVQVPASHVLIFTILQHVIVNEDLCPQNLIFQTTAINLYKLNAVHSSVFGPPYSAPGMDFPAGIFFEYWTEKITELFPKKTIVGRNLMKLILGPLESIGVDTSEQLDQVDVNKVKEEIAKFPEFQECISQLQQQLQQKLILEHSTAREFEVVFLGTGAALPSKYRNVSSIYMEYSQHNSAMLLDAGEGSYGQLFRKYGTEFDSLMAKESKTYEPLLIVGPTLLGVWLEEYSKNVEQLAYQFIPCSEITNKNNVLTSFMMTHFGLQLFYTVPVIHCPDSYALVVQHSSGWKLLYSGDTRPCEALVKEGKDATLLIHEATLEDDMMEDALEKNHCTTAEAINIGMKMNAYRILLTHFSQRYPKIPTFDSKHEDRICVAFDMMTINSTNLDMLPKLLPSLRCLFQEEEEQAEREAARLREEQEYEQQTKKKPKRG